MKVDFFEIDFLPVGDGKDSGDAIALRYRANAENFVHVIDGGYLKDGLGLVGHVSHYYSTSYVDHVVCTHADTDHASGLRTVLENCTVGTLWMNRPWRLAKHLFPILDDGRITEDSLVRRLREEYSYISELEDLAVERGVKIVDAFAGAQIGLFTVCSPSVQFYFQMLVESHKTPDATLTKAGKWITALEALARPVQYLFEAWDIETLRDDVSTHVENEMSVVQYGLMNGHHFLLTGDAGPRALTAAAEYAEANLGHRPGGLHFVQVPHHGSRHNVTPQILNRWLGPILPKNTQPQNLAYASVSQGAKGYPRQAVINAFHRRGYEVSSTRGETLCHFGGNCSPREGWGPVVPHRYSQQVEAWD